MMDVTPSDAGTAAAAEADVVSRVCPRRMARNPGGSKPTRPAHLAAIPPSRAMRWTWRWSPWIGPPGRPLGSTAERHSSSRRAASTRWPEPFLKGRRRITPSMAASLGLGQQVSSHRPSSGRHWLIPMLCSFKQGPCRSKHRTPGQRYGHGLHRVQPEARSWVAGRNILIELLPRPHSSRSEAATAPRPTAPGRAAILAPSRRPFAPPRPSWD